MELEQRAVQFLQALVRQASISGEEEGAAEVAANEMRQLGFDEVWRDTIGNVIGKLVGKTPGKKVLFDAHIDVVPATTPEKWYRSPFSGEFSEGRVWGRGATDNKGSLSAMVYGLAAIPRAEIAGTIYVVGSVGEETYEGVGLAQAIDALMPDCVIVGEPTDCRLGYGQRGRARLVFHARGRAGHSSANDQSGNAVYSMASVIERIERHELMESELGAGIQAPIELISNPYPSLSTVPVDCKLTVDRRLLLGETEETILNDYRAELIGLENAAVEIDTVTYTGYTGLTFTESDFHPAWITSAGTSLVQACTEAIRDGGVEPVLYPIPYCTNGSYSGGVKGIPTVVFGPGSILQAHAIDEYLDVNELFKAARVYTAMGRFVGKNE